MADDYDYDVDDTLGYDDDWLYVEDEFLLADELAETQIPDPGYSGTNHEIDLEQWDYDLYMFWDDQEYGYDEYWDYGGLGVKVGSDQTGQKRKRPAATNTGTATKRRRGEGKHAISIDSDSTKYDNVVYMSRQARAARRRDLVPHLVKATKSAFLSDWRARFANNTGTTSSKQMPSEMARAAQAQAEPEDAADEVDDPAVPGAAERELEAGAEEVEEDDGAKMLQGLDPEMLKTILQQRLGEAGLKGVDEKAFVEAMQSMLSGDGSADDMMGELANALLGQASDAQGGAVNGWLSQQGISLEDGEEDDGLSVGAAEAVSRRGKLAQTSPRDSAVSVADSAESFTPREKGEIQADTPPSRKAKDSVPSDMGPPKKTEQKHSRKRKAAIEEVNGEDEAEAQPAAKRTRAAKAKTRKL